MCQTNSAGRGGIKSCVVSNLFLSTSLPYAILASHRFSRSGDHQDEQSFNGIGFKPKGLQPVVFENWFQTRICDSLSGGTGV